MPTTSAVTAAGPPSASDGSQVWSGTSGDLTPKPTRKSRKTRIWISRPGARQAARAGRNSCRRGWRERGRPATTARHRRASAGNSASLPRTAAGEAPHSDKAVERQQRQLQKKRRARCRGRRKSRAWRPRAAGRRHRNPRRRRRRSPADDERCKKEQRRRRQEKDGEAVDADEPVDPSPGIHGRRCSNWKSLRAASNAPAQPAPQTSQVPPSAARWCAPAVHRAQTNKASAPTNGSAQAARQRKMQQQVIASASTETRGDRLRRRCGQVQPRFGHEACRQQHEQRSVRRAGIPSAVRVRPASPLRQRRQERALEGPEQESGRGDVAKRGGDRRQRTEMLDGSLEHEVQRRIPAYRACRRWKSRRSGTRWR